MVVTDGVIIFDHLNADYGAAFDSNEGEIAFCQSIEKLLPPNSSILDAGEYPNYNVMIIPLTSLLI